MVENHVTVKAGLRITYYLGGERVQYWYYQGNVCTQISPVEHDLRGM